MAVSSRQQYFLQEMGIPVWQVRTAKTLAVEEFNLNPALSAVVVVADIVLSQEASRLLNAILKSVSLAIEQVDLISFSTLQSLDEAMLSGKKILLMDDNARQSMVESHYICLPSLSALMRQPELKRLAWQRLKTLS